MPPDYDYEAGTFRLLEAQLAGFYEPHDKTMYLAADSADRAADATLAHELVHALQDQVFHLGAQLAYKPESNDRASAIEALAEGDATSAMMDVLLAETHRAATDVSDDVFAAEVESSMSTGPDTGHVPRVLAASLVAPYVDGVLFVHALRRKGDWSAVDKAWHSPPQTTEQLLHLEKFESQEKPESVPAPGPPAGSGWKRAYDDVFGEQGLRIVAEEWLPKRRPRSPRRDGQGTTRCSTEKTTPRLRDRRGVFLRRLGGFVSTLLWAGISSRTRSGRTACLCSRCIRATPRQRRFGAASALSWGPWWWRVRVGICSLLPGLTGVPERMSRRKRFARKRFGGRPNPF